MKTFTVYAPLIQINFQASDLPAITSSGSGPQSTSQGAIPSLTGSSPASPTGNPTITSDPVASLIPSSLRTSKSATTTSGSTDVSDTDDSSSSSGMTTGTKVGIGVGVSAGVIVLVVIAFFFGRFRRKDKSALGEDEKGTAGSANGKTTGLGRKKSTRAELGGYEIMELEGNKTQELPATAISVGTLREPAAIFELPADIPNTLLKPPRPTSAQGDVPVSPVTPVGPGERRPVSPVTPVRASHESTAPMHESNLRNELT